MKKAELVFIPATGTGHLVSTVEIAKLLIDRDDRLSITILLVVKLPSDNKVITFTESLTAASNFPSRIKFFIVPDDDQPENQQPVKLFSSFIETQKPQVKEAVTKLTQSPDSPQLAGFVLDMLCTCMIEIADEFKVPSYVFFTSSAAYLGFMFHVQALHDEENFETIELNDSDFVVEVPSFANSVPAKVWPTALFSKEYIDIFYQQARKFRGVKGIMVNTFEELESYAIRSLSNDKTETPPVYAVGPILNINGETLGPGGAQSDDKSDIMSWLDDQPESTVVFLCFGSVGSFDEDQVKEIACALEQSGHRFLWSLRRVRSTDKIKTAGTSIEYMDPKDVLPEGFFDRTAQIGKVIGWAPQVAILGHRAIGGFVSHCGWNSTLESIWFGVPLATWPVYAEQQINAFELVMELGLAVEIKMDYKNDFTVENVKMVSAMEIERGISCVMEHGSEVRKRIKEKSDEARKSLLDGGSSFSSVRRLIDDVWDNIV